MVVLAAIAHELRTPLSTMLWWVRLLREDVLQAATRSRALDVLERNLKGQGRLIDDLFDLSSLLTGKFRLRARLIDLAPVVESAVDAVYFEAHARGLRLDTAIPEAALPVVGDSDRLQQVFSNLLLNAIKFSHPGGRVDVGVERSGRGVRIRVVDRGLGISPDDLPAIFRLFRQAASAPARARGGLGVGLAIARDLVEMHGGKIVAESRGLDMGATFTVTLPLAPPSLVTAASAEPRLDDLRVLMVLPDGRWRDSLSTMLEGTDAVVTTAVSVADTVRAIDTHRPDVLVIDMGRGGKCGEAVIRAVRALASDRGGRTPAIALTAHGRTTAERVDLVAVGFQAHVRKPVDRRELLGAIVGLAGLPSPVGADRR